jgi:hypothetical protein
MRSLRELIAIALPFSVKELRNELPINEYPVSHCPKTTGPKLFKYLLFQDGNAHFLKYTERSFFNTLQLMDTKNRRSLKDKSTIFHARTP